MLHRSQSVELCFSFCKVLKTPNKQFLKPHDCCRTVATFSYWKSIEGKSANTVLNSCFFIFKLQHGLNDKLPVTFLYGENTWMNNAYGQIIKDSRPSSYTHVEIVENAGHHVTAFSDQS